MMTLQTAIMAEQLSPWDDPDATEQKGDTADICHRLEKLTARSLTAEAVISYNSGDRIRYLLIDGLRMVSLE